MNRYHTVFWMLFFSVVHAWTGEWQVNKEAENTVTFYSSTTLLDFSGTTSNIDGYIYWEGTDFFEGKNEFYFEVQPATFKTGLSKRDSDIREDVLETGKFPLSSFKGAIVNIERADSLYNITASGIFFLHGIEKKMDIQGTINVSKNSMLVKSTFSIFLKDFQIAAPSLLAFVKVAEEIKLQLDFRLIKIK